MAVAEAALESYAAYQVGRRHHAEGRALLEDAAERYDDRMDSIGETLIAQLDAAHMVLQTTTIDPAATWSGAIVADQPPLADSEVRQATVSVSFAGETHRFNLFLAPEGVSTPPQVSLPAVSRRDSEVAISGTPRTWLWDQPSPAATTPPQTWTTTRF